MAILFTLSFVATSFAENGQKGSKKATTAAKQVKAKSKASGGYFAPINESDSLSDDLQVVYGDWQVLAESLDYSGPICWKVKAGFSMKQVSGLGLYKKKFKHLDVEDFRSKPTEAGVVFWIPRLLPEKYGQEELDLGSVQQYQESNFDWVNSEFDIELTSFGSLALLSGLIHNYQKVSGKRVPLSKCSAITDNVTIDAHNVHIGQYNADGLDCIGNLIDPKCEDAGFFPLQFVPESHVMSDEDNDNDRVGDEDAPE